MRRTFASVAFVPLTLLPLGAAATTCSIPTACFLAANSGTGAGVEGTSAGSYGVLGITTFNATKTALRGIGVYGQDRSVNRSKLDYGVLGTSTYGTGTGGLSVDSDGVRGQSTSSYGVYGVSGGAAGVYGFTSAVAPATLGYVAGVLGINGSTSSTSTAAGVIGRSTKSGYGVAGFSNAAVGVYGVDAVGTGVYGSSTSGIGVNGYGAYGGDFNASSVGVYASAPSYGLYAQSSNIAVQAFGGSEALNASSTSGYGAIVTTGGNGTAVPAGYFKNGKGNAIDATGTYIGVVARAPASGGFPLVATDAAGNNLFYVDGAGNVSYHGTLNTFARTRGGREATTFSPQTTAPTLEDVGSAQLVAGQATVTFGAEFAAALDPREIYHVFLTPDGDTRGLFVAEKTPRGFVVRETQGGRSSLAFDYRVVGASLGNAGKRTSFIERQSVPNALPVTPPAPHAITVPKAGPVR